MVIRWVEMEWAEMEWGERVERNDQAKTQNLRYPNLTRKQTHLPPHCHCFSIRFPIGLPIHFPIRLYPVLCVFLPDNSTVDAVIRVLAAVQNYLVLFRDYHLFQDYHQQRIPRYCRLHQNQSDRKLALLFASDLEKRDKCESIGSLDKRENKRSRNQ